MSSAAAHAKINIGLAVGSLRDDGKHEVVTLMQRVDLHDDVTVEPADDLSVDGFAGDTIVTATLTALARSAHISTGWRVHLEKRIPVASGLGGGSSDAAAALALANASLDTPLPHDELLRIAATVGADIPFFLEDGSQLATGDGTDLEYVSVPTEFSVLLVVPHGQTKESTKSVYEAFDRHRGADRFAARAAAFRGAARAITRPRDLAALPPNDLASSPLAHELLAMGAFRADVTGAGPTVYGLFDDHESAAASSATLGMRGDVFLTRPVAAGGRTRVAR